jgi:hypothetical protein
VLAENKPPWLEIGGELQPGEILWIWSWEDGRQAVKAAVRGEPFICGPNVLFSNSKNPCAISEEQYVCEAASCLLLFTESAWYAELIQSQLKDTNLARIVIWPYPIAPIPPPPVELRYDVIVYLKTRMHANFVRQLLRAWPRTRGITYGSYTREQLWDTARRSACCIYVSDDDRGPLALAEIMLCGCPAVGVPGGAPWIEEGVTGSLVKSWTVPDVWQAVERCRAMDRIAVRARAVERFDGTATREVVLAALERLV